MKRYVKTVMSFMVMSLFLMMAVASLDPADEVPQAKDCEFLPQPVQKMHKISVSVVDYESKLPLENVKISLIFGPYLKEFVNTDCYLVPDDFKYLNEKTNNQGKFLFNISREYISPDDYSQCGFNLTIDGYYSTSRVIILKYQNNDISVHFNLLKINKTP